MTTRPPQAGAARSAEPAEPTGLAGPGGAGGAGDGYDDGASYRPVIRSHARITDRTRAIVRGLGEALITFGMVILLFCVYQLFYTNLEANRAQAQERQELRDDWRPPEEAAEPLEPVIEGFDGIDDGDSFAIMYIPKFGSGWDKPLLEGEGLDNLSRGVAHYEGTAMPGELGNFAVAGHRTTHGQPFHNIDQLEQGDLVIIETENNWYRYVIDEWEIVAPTEVDVVLPVPRQPGVEPTDPLITLTTCHPKWSSEKRLIYRGHLEDVQNKANGTPAELLR